MLFEQHGCAFQEVAQQNDFGKDAYVDLAADGAVTPLCVAVQVKSGVSYRTAAGDYFVPVEQHAETWRASTVPVFGLVYDPDDHGLRWVDLTGYLRAHPDVSSGNVPVGRNVLLTAGTLRGVFANAVARYMESGSESGDIALHLLSRNDALQDSAVFDAWALGRRDARFLFILRRLLLELRPRALRRAICLLSYCGSHPDVFWTPDNWIQPDIEQAVLPSFRWSPQEVAHMIAAIDVSDYGRGTLGQCLDVLLHEDPSAREALRAAVGLLQPQSLDLAVRAATLALIRTKNQAAELTILRERYPRLDEHEWFADIAASVEEAGRLSLY
jgi:hypothetical protein